MMVWQTFRRRIAAGAVLSLVLLGNLSLTGCGGGSSSVTLPGENAGGGGSGGGGGGGNPGGGSGGGGSSNGAITAEQRVASLDAVRDKFQSLVGQDPAAANQELLRFLQSRPEFEASGEDREMLTVWARYRDGRLMVIPNNRPIAGSRGRMAAPTPVPATGRAFDLPSSKKVRLLHALGKGFDPGQDAIDDVRSWLTANGYEDVPVQEADARISSLKNVRGDGVFWFNTHGGPGKRRDGSEPFVLWTSSVVDVNTEKIPEIEADLDQGRLAYAPGQVENTAGDAVVENHYAITPEFVRQYMQFEKNSLVLMTVCYSSNPKPPIRAMVQAFHQKSAGVYIGWTNVINDAVGFRAGKVLVDWMLGANQFEKQTPPQRPFDLDQVVQFLRGKGWDVYPASGARLTIERNPAIPASEAFGLLAPSISFVVDDTSKDELVIQGQFGQDPGADRKVTINGVDLSVTKWTDTEIRCTLPRTGAGSAGDVVVTARGHRSNPRWLTEWRGDFRYSFAAPGSLLQTMTFRLHFRADVDSLRPGPGVAPFQPPLVGAFLSGDSNADYAASGEASATDNECTTTLKWSGAGPMPRFLPGNVDPPPFWGGQVLLNPGGRAISLQLEAHSGDAMITEARHTVCPTGTNDTQSPNSLRIINDVFKDASGTLDMTFDSDFNILGGSRQKTIVFGGLPGGPKDAIARLEWSRITARFPPDPNAARSVGP